MAVGGFVVEPGSAAAADLVCRLSTTEAPVGFSEWFAPVVCIKAFFWWLLRIETVAVALVSPHLSAGKPCLGWAVKVVTKAFPCRGFWVLLYRLVFPGPLLDFLLSSPLFLVFKHPFRHNRHLMTGLSLF